MKPTMEMARHNNSMQRTALRDAANAERRPLTMFRGIA